MIQIYLPENSKYENNGNMVLFPTECVITANLNADWNLSLKHPLDSNNRWKYISDGAVIKAPSFNGEQLFRIFHTDLNETEISAEAYPIFLDACSDTFLFDVRPTKVNGQTALNKIFEGTKYQGKSDIVKTATAYYQNQNAVSAINGDTDQAFTSRWGGQIIYDNFKIIINQRAGGDYGATLRYGKNILGMSQKINRNNLCTRIIPQAYNGYMLDGKTPWVNSPLINSYPVVYTKLVKFDDVKLSSDAQSDEESFPNLAALRRELIRRSNLMFSEENVDKEDVTLDINVELLENTAEYKKFSGLEQISLGDTATCINEKLGISVKTQAISITYDCIKNKTQNIVLGSFQPNYFTNNTLSVEQISSDIVRNENTVNDVTSTVKKITNSDGTINAEKVQGALNGANVQLKAQTDAAQQQDIRAILFQDLNPNSELYGALSIGTQGIQISKTRTADGKDWQWHTAITANGVVADELVGQFIRGIAIEADKGNIAGFEITSTGFKKTWHHENKQGQKYDLIFDISSESGSTSEKFIIKLYDEGAGEYSFAVSDWGHGIFNALTSKEVRVLDALDTPKIRNNTDQTNIDFGHIAEPFVSKAANAQGRWRQLKWCINKSNVGVLQPLDQNGTEYSTCTIGESNHRWNRIYLYYSPDVVSDPDKKKNIKNFDKSVVEFIKALTPCFYNMRNEMDSDPLHMGLMAPELNEAATKTIGKVAASHYDEKYGWSLSYEELIAPLIYTLQQLIDKVEKLEEGLKIANDTTDNA